MFLSPCNESSAFARLHEQALDRLDQLAAEVGSDSTAYKACAEMWREREENARVSVSYGDLRNALVILERAVAALTLAPSILARHELGVDELTLLLKAA